MGDTPTSCRNLTQQVSDYLDGALIAALVDSFEEHLGFCDDCVSYIAHTRLAISLVRDLPRPDAPQALVDALARKGAE